MDFFSIMKEKLNKAGDFAVKKSNEVVEVTKLKFAISDIDSKISDAYKTIGKLTFRALSEEADTTDEVTELCARVKELKEELDGLNDKLYAAKNLTKCPNCSYPSDEETAFCPKCGEKLI